MGIKEPIRVLLVDDHARVREALRSLLQTYLNIDIVGEAGDGISAIRMVTTLRPAVVIMDINLPGMDGITATRIIKSNHPDIAVIGLSFSINSATVYAMRKAGAHEVMAKEKAVHELYAAIQRAIASIRPVGKLDTEDTALEFPQVFVENSDADNPTPAF